MELSITVTSGFLAGWLSELGRLVGELAGDIDDDDDDEAEHEDDDAPPWLAAEMDEPAELGAELEPVELPLAGLEVAVGVVWLEVGRVKFLAPEE